MECVRGDPLLLTPGPLTTASATKEAMLHDWGSRDQQFVDATRDVRGKLVEISGGGGAFTAVPMQGSGTFAVEAMIGTFLPRDGKLLIGINGAYGHRIAKICDYMGRAYVVSEIPENLPLQASTITTVLESHPEVTHVAIVQCETTSGILNPVGEIASAVDAMGRRLLVDAMSAFGAIPLDLSLIVCDAVAASSNKCFEGVPGMGFVLCRQTALKNSENNAHSLSLDLFDQWKTLEDTGQWRFTPPTHVVFAFKEALYAYLKQGGLVGRFDRYSKNCRILVEGMRGYGFQSLLSDNLQAPIIVSFRMPADLNFRFENFYDMLKAKGFVIYPGKLAVAESFRIGCIGAIDENDMRAAVSAIGETLEEMGVASGRPA